MLLKKKATRAAIPNVFVRSGMFTVKSFRNVDREIVSRSIFTNDAGRYSIHFDGYELNQNDYQVYASLLKQQRNSGLTYGSTLTIPVSNILTDIGFNCGGANYENVWDTMARLKRANVSILSGKRRYEGSLILEIERDARNHMSYALSNRISDLFDDDCTYVDLSVIVSLKNMMSKWLYSYYRSHSMHIPISVKKIRELMCAPERMETKEFNRVLRQSLTEVSKIGNGPFVGWKIEDEILSVYKTGKMEEVVSNVLNDIPDPFASRR